MGYTKEQLLARLKELDIVFTQYEHPAVVTMDAALKYVGHVEGAFANNLFLKDRKQRLYLISALSDTKVDEKVLSRRLGFGKEGLKMAPEEALANILQVPLGCLTPLAVINDSARDVCLLLDQRLRSQKCCLFHPLSNDMSIALNTSGLDSFLKSTGRVPVYVDLEANPPVGKDQLPDLAAFVPSAAADLPKPSGEAASVTEKSVERNIEVKSNRKTANTKNTKHKTQAVPSPKSFANAQLFVDEMLDKASALILSEITNKSVEEHGEKLGAVVSDRLRRCLCSDLNNLAMIFKNTAYTEGFHANSPSHAK